LKNRTYWLIDNLKDLIMNKTINNENCLSISIHSTRVGDLLRISAGKSMFLVSRQGIAVRKEIIDHEIYSRVKMEGSSAIHLDYNRIFILQDKLLEVQAKSHTSYGPLGDRMFLAATYDGVELGQFKGMISYMGGGTQGQWPVLLLDNETVFFTFSSSGMGGKTNELLIEYFQHVHMKGAISTEKPKLNSIAGDQLPEGFLEQQFRAENLVGMRKLEWEIPVPMEEGVATLRCYRYPGITQYKKEFYGNWTLIKEQKGDREWIGPSLNGEDLYAIEFVKNEDSEIHFPWAMTSVNYTL
jgi:hypothetical protein